MKTVKEIRMEFDSAPVKKWRELYEIYGKDERQGVRKLLEQYRKKKTGWKRKCSAWSR